MQVEPERKEEVVVAGQAAKVLMEVAIATKQKLGLTQTGPCITEREREREISPGTKNTSKLEQSIC